MKVIGRLKWSVILAILCTLLSGGLSDEDLPCRARDLGIPGRSIVCVCNAEYCDTITRVEPERGTFVVYTSTNAGQRFQKTFGQIQTVQDPTPEPTTPIPTTAAPTTAAPTTAAPTTAAPITAAPTTAAPTTAAPVTEATTEIVTGPAIATTEATQAPVVTTPAAVTTPEPVTEAPIVTGPVIATTEQEIVTAPATAPPVQSADESVKNLLKDVETFQFLRNPMGYMEEDDEIDIEEEIQQHRENFDEDAEDIETEGRMYSTQDAWDNVELRVFTSTRRQFIEGFGGSVTDAASINWRKLSDRTQQNFIDSYFGAKGLEYNLIRVPIAGSDFSTHPYTYNELPWRDHALTNFSLTDEDYLYKLPMIKRSQRAATSEIKITASTWSPPIWMKTNEAITGFGQLLPEFYQSYADYHVRFMEEYEKVNVKIWAITTTNEPINGIVPFVQFNSLGWTPSQLGKWVADNLGPTIRGSRYNETLILAVDDQRYIIPIWLRGMETEDPKSIEYIDGIAIHYYGNFVPPAILSRVQQRYPGKILLSTEACEGAMPWHLMRVEHGSWRRARRYVSNILEDLNNFVVGWIDWNLCLDHNGGPNWANNFVDAPILVYGDEDEFIKQPMFYAMGHFSKFIPRGSRVISVSRRSVLSVENIAVLKQNGNIVMVLQNRRTRRMNIKIYISSRRYVSFVMEPQSIKTIEINP